MLSSGEEVGARGLGKQGTDWLNLEGAHLPSVLGAEEEASFMHELCRAALLL